MYTGLIVLLYIHSLGLCNDPVDYSTLDVSLVSLHYLLELCDNGDICLLYELFDIHYMHSQLGRIKLMVSFSSY